MKLFRQILRRTPEVEPLEVRIRKLNDLPQTELEAIVGAEDQEIELRKSAIELIPYGPFLQAQALYGGYAPELEKLARQKIATLIDDDKADVSELLVLARDTNALLAISSFCKKIDLESQILAGIEDEVLLSELCLASSSSTVRQRLSHRITRPELLRHLAKSLKHKDKTAYKLVKAKVDSLKEKEQKAAEYERNILSLCIEVEQQSARHVDKEYTLKVDRLQRRWNEVEEHASREEKDQFQSFIKVCISNIEKYEGEIKASEEYAEKVSEVSSERQKLLNELWMLVDGLYSLETADVDALEKTRTSALALREDWSALRQYGKPTSAESKDYTQMCDALDILVTSFQDNGSLLEAYHVLSKEGIEEQEKKSLVKRMQGLLHPIENFSMYSMPKSVVQAVAAIEEIDTNYQNMRERREKQLRYIGGLLRKALAAAQQGRLKQAIGIRHSIDEKAENIDSLPAALSRQLEDLDESIQKLLDWQAYAVVPKKQALIQSMKKLVGVDIPPEALATKIKKLQEEWKSLSQSGKDRQEELWKEFSELSDRAYEPCKTYYQELAEIRKQNLAKRQTLVRQLEDFYRDYSWDNADWKQVETILNTARNELRGYAPVDRAANKPVLEAFEKAITAIQDKLYGEFQKNTAAKEQLILQAAKLADLADVQQAIDVAKRLQVQWKSIGRSHYRDNDKLWKNFRRHCDVVFDRKQKQYEEQKAKVDTLVASARGILEKLVAMVDLPSEQLLAARSERDELQKEFRALEGLPEKVHKGIERDIKNAVERIEAKLNEIKRANEAEAWNTYFEVCRRINDHFYQLSRAPEEAQPASNDVEDFIASVSRWPEGVLSAIKQRLSRVTAEAEDDNVKALKILCIRAEILAERNTPEADKALRMEYQVNMLKKGMGLTVVNEKAGSTLAKDWVGASGVDEHTYRVLFERFHESWRQLHG